MLRDFFAPIHKDGWKFVAGFVAVTIVFFFIAAPLGWFGVVASVWCAYFFRDPWRVTPTREGLVISPADGLVVSIGPARPPAELDMGEEKMLRIGIFLSVLDVHVNRIPMSGRVVKLAYHSGKFLSANLDKASEDNERMAVRIKTTTGPDIAVVQIAGFVARRILCHLTDRQDVFVGERFGLIRFGSRTDVYLPTDWTPLIVVGQRAIGGETVLADSQPGQAPRTGISH